MSDGTQYLQRVGKTRRPTTPPKRSYSVLRYTSVSAAPKKGGTR